MNRELNAKNFEVIIGHMDRETFDERWHQMLKEKRHRDELDLLATTSRCAAPKNPVTDPCHLCPYNKADKPAKPNPIDTEAATG